MTKLELNSNIYSKSSVRRTIAVYKEYAHISSEIKGELFIITFSKCRFDEQKAAKEFENYLIGVENSE